MPGLHKFNWFWTETYWNFEAASCYTWIPHQRTRISNWLFLYDLVFISIYLSPQNAENIILIQSAVIWFRKFPCTLAKKNFHENNLSKSAMSQIRSVEKSRIKLFRIGISTISETNTECPSWYVPPPDHQQARPPLSCPLIIWIQTRCETIVREVEESKR